MCITVVTKFVKIIVRGENISIDGTVSLEFNLKKRSWSIVLERGSDACGISESRRPRRRKGAERIRTARRKRVPCVPIDVQTVLALKRL